MCQRYGKYKLTNFPQRLFEMPFSELMACEQQLREEFGFSKQEIKHIASQKPTLLLFREEYQKESRGIIALKKVFCEEMNFPYEMVKNLVVKYPVILGKSED